MIRRRFPLILTLCLFVLSLPLAAAGSPSPQGSPAPSPTPANKLPSRPPPPTPSPAPGSGLPLAPGIPPPAKNGAAQSPAMTAPRPTLTLEQALRTAMRQNPQLVQFREQRLAVHQRELQAASRGLPFIALESVAKDGPRSAPGLGFMGLANSSIVDNYGSDLVLSQYIADFGRVLHSVRASRYLTESAAFDEASQQNYVALLVYQTYNNVLKAESLLVVAREDLASRELVVRQAQARFDAGLISRIDVDLAQSALAQSKLNVIQAENQVKQSYADLNTALGINAPTTWVLQDIPQSKAAVPQLAGDLEIDVQNALHHRPEMQALEAQAASFAESAKAAAAEGKPLLRAIATVGQLQVTPADVSSNQAYAAGLLLTWPLYTGGLIQAQVSEARHQQLAVLAQRSQLSDTLRQQVTQSRLFLVGLIQSQAVVEEQLLQSADAVKLATERYEFGLGTLLEVQQAQVLLLSAENTAVRLRYDIETGQAALLYATGLLEIPVLGP